MRTLMPGGGPASRLVASIRDMLEPVGRIFVVRLVLRTAQEVSDDDATHLAAGVSFYALFSLFPLLLGLTALLSFYADSEEVRRDLAELVANYLPGSEGLIDRNLEVAYNLRGAIGLFSIAGLLWSSSAVFGAITRAVNRAWDVHRDRPIYIGKPRQLLMAALVGMLFALSLLAPTLLRVTANVSESDLPGVGLFYDGAARIGLQGLSLGLTIVIFLAIYKFLPNTKTYWKYVWVGAVVAGVLFEIAKNLFIVYVERLADFENVYGSLAPVIALLLWAYVSSFILILGAELSSEYGRMRSGVDRGRLMADSLPQR